MKDKGVVKVTAIFSSKTYLLHHLVSQDVLKWRESRQFFYWRLRRRLNEEVALRVVMDADRSDHYGDNHSSVYSPYHLPLSSTSRGEAMQLLKRWFVEDKGTLNVSVILCCYSNQCPFLPLDVPVAPRPGSGAVVGGTSQLSLLGRATECRVHQEGVCH